MQYAREGIGLGIFAPDVDDAGVREFLREHIVDPLERRHVESVEQLIDEQPRRLAYQDACEHQRLLFVFGQYLVPTPRHVELCDEPLEPDAAQCVGERLRDRGLDRRRIGQDLAQRARAADKRVRGMYKIGSPFGRVMVPAPKGHKPASARKTKVFRAPDLTDDQHSIAALDLHVRLREPRRARQRRDRQLLDANLAGSAVGHGDAAFGALRRVADQRAAEHGDPQQRRAPIGDRAEIVDEPAQRGLHLHECAGRRRRKRHRSQ